MRKRLKIVSLLTALALLGGSAGRHQIGNLSPAESTPACRTGQIPQRGPDRVLFAGG